MKNNKIRKQFIWIVSCSLTVYAFSGGKGDCGLHGNCGWPMVGVFCLTVWRAACWDGHWSWQSECQPIIFIAGKKKEKKKSRNQEKCITRGSIYAQGKYVCFLDALSTGFLRFVETSNTPRVIFKYVDAVNNNNNFFLEVLWQYYETGSAFIYLKKKCIHLYFF